jgi:leucyl-tRNA synthetase
MSRTIRCAATALVCSLLLCAAAWSEPTTAPSTRPVKPKELSANVKKGLEWLASSQLKSGAWGQGEEASGMRSGENERPRDAGNVDIEAAVLALDAVRRALDGKAPKKVIVVPQRIVNVVA